VLYPPTSKLAQCSDKSEHGWPLCPKIEPIYQLVNNRRFGGISPKDRIWPSRFDQARTSMARIALRAEDAREQIEIRHTSFLLKMVCYSEMSQSAEMVSNLQRKFFYLKVRHRGSQSSIFVRTFRSFTMYSCERIYYYYIHSCMRRA
jgi:hypothetical protein